MQVFDVAKWRLEGSVAEPRPRCRSVGRSAQVLVMSYLIASYEVAPVVPQ